MIEIPNFKNLDIRHIVCDYNGTIAKDGKVHPKVKALFEILSKSYTLHVITADTFGSVHQQLQDHNTHIKVLSGSDHTKEKAEYIASLGSEHCAALGNGNNDVEMLRSATIGIAILGEEGCAKEALFSADMVCKEITDALLAFIHPKRLIATLRK
ncbi:HAD family hydrolase [Sulfurovum sp.]|uniref:HAD family hydrolase n=1 Tax=Sulfurovum sp. TaxID=1969726 RepID=UPI0025DD471B|nr:HAD hydrolase family protein [Sulfurovum sp.]